MPLLTISEYLSPEGWLNQALSSINEFLWGWHWHSILIVLAVCGVYFTIRTRFVQFRMVPEMFRLLCESSPLNKKKNQVSSFQAFAVSLATRVGTGNLAGVAGAIAVGGPGAVFWMWIIALLGSATAFVESTLAQLYKRRNGESFIGGPAYYILHGTHWRWMASLFAVLMILTFGLSYNSIQSNTIAEAMHSAFGFDTTIVGIVLTVMALVIVFGGIHRIAIVSSVMVPLMAIGYFVLALVVIVMNYSLIPGVFRLIVDNAFGIGPMAGGMVGVAMREGVRRGLFSNEAGEGSAPNVAATATVSHPVKQGLIQALGVFTDTLIVCSCTAFIILLSGLYDNGTLEGITLTQSALETQVGSSGKIYVAIAIFFFAFSSIIGNYYYGESNIVFLTKKKWVLTIYRLLSGGFMVILGALASLKIVWNMGEVFMALITLCNLLAILILGKYAFALLKDYKSQRRQGIKSPEFKRSTLSEIEKDIDAWD
ncbi:MAG: alanine:cation symporter family protein [Muribaculaceae bacterium]|nr:alanine:cation symporter family protein [Muribaculaceae bacterium]